MKSVRTSLIVAAAIVVIPFVFVLLVSWPSWIAIVISVLLLLVLAVRLRPATDERALLLASAALGGVGQDAADSLRTPPPSKAISDVRLPSASPKYRFSFSAVVHWSLIGAATHADPAGLATDALLTRARATTAAQEPTEVAANEPRLAALLGEPALDEKGQLQVWATEVQLRLPAEDLRHLQSLADFDRREETERLQRRLEQETRAYLKDDVFATTGSAAIWWLARNPGEIEKCVALFGDLQRISAAANGRLPNDDEHDDLGRPVITSESVQTGPSDRAAVGYDGAVELFLGGHDTFQRSLKADALADLEARFNRPDRAQQIRDLHDVEPVGAGPSDESVGSHPATAQRPEPARGLGADGLAGFQGSQLTIRPQIAPDQARGFESAGSASVASEDQPADDYREKFVSD